MHWIHSICQKLYNWTNTQSRTGKRVTLFGYELDKHLAATVLGGLPVLYLSFSAQKGAEITEFNYRKLQIGVIVCNCLVF